MSEHTSSPLNGQSQLDSTDHLDPSLALIAAKLDQLAHNERSLPDAGFEGRILAHVPVAKHFPRLVLTGDTSEKSAPVMITRSSNFSGSYWAMRLAAAVAIVSGVGAVWMATRGPTPTNNLIANNGSSTNKVDDTQDLLTQPKTAIADANIDENDLLFAVAFGDESVDDLQDLRQVAEILEVSMDTRMDVNDYFSEEGATQ